MDDLTLAQWAPNYSFKPQSATEWLNLLDAQLTKAADAGAKIFILPEYISMQWLSFAAPYAGEIESNQRMAEIGLGLLPAIQARATAHDMLIVFGSFPVAASKADTFHNRCHVVFPEDEIAGYDKLCLLPIEKGDMRIVPGTNCHVFTWRDMRIAVVICLDCELPALAARLATQNLDLLLIPSQTCTEAGYARVFGCAKARAIELACPVAVMGGIGTCEFPSGAVEHNVSGAAVYLPCESTGIENGVLASVGPLSSLEAKEGLLQIVENVPVAACRALRNGKADVWPGAWTADHVNFSEWRVEGRESAPLLKRA